MDLRPAGLTATRLVAFGCVALAAFWACASDQGHRIRLLSEPEKASTVASDGPAPPTCWKLVQAPCELFNAAGNLTGCGGCSFPNCTGSTTNSCASAMNNTQECPADPNGNVGQCPTLTANNVDTSCGNQQNGGTCASVTGSCCVIGGTDNTPVVPCGQPNLKYNGPALTACPA